MQFLIEREIRREAKKRLTQHSKARYLAHKHQVSFRKRTGKAPKRAIHTIPKSWDFHCQFDPRYCLKHAPFLAKGLWRSLSTNNYAPVPAMRSLIPKPAGGTRIIDAFSIPDAAIARIFLNSLNTRNSKIFSDSSYAYQKNKTPLDAIIRLKGLLNSQVVFISQYDFSKYFDSIDHEYLSELLETQGRFLTTHMERCVLRAIMTHKFELSGAAVEQRDTGIPQGNSLSLFLANVAAHPLDDQLTKLSGAFARFADDSVVVNYRYEDALACANAFQKFSEQSGVSLNLDKTTGIRMFSAKEAEMRHIEHFEFLGYKFQRDGLHMGYRAVATIKRRCAKIVYNHLLLHPRRMRSINRKRLGPGFRDWDLVTCLNELRAYIYGGNNQATINKYLDDKLQIRNLTGPTSYFCLVEDSEVFRDLDGWLIDIIHRGYAARVALAQSIFKGALRTRIGNISKKELTEATWYNFPSVPMETDVPSFFLAWRAARKSWTRHGLGGVDARGLEYGY